MPCPPTVQPNPQCPRFPSAARVEPTRSEQLTATHQLTATSVHLSSHFFADRGWFNLSPSPLSASFLQLQHEIRQRWFSHICCRRNHVSRRLTEFSQVFVGHFAEARSQRINVQGRQLNGSNCCSSTFFIEQQHRRYKCNLQRRLHRRNRCKIKLL